MNKYLLSGLERGIKFYYENKDNKQSSYRWCSQGIIIVIRISTLDNNIVAIRTYIKDKNN